MVEVRSASVRREGVGEARLEEESSKQQCDLKELGKRREKRKRER